MESRKKVSVDLPNAFIGRKTPPSSKDVVAKLGPSATAWRELIQWLEEQGIECKEWKSISPRYGWSFRPALRTRTVLYLGPCDGCFRASFVLGDKAVAAARASDLPKTVLNEIAQARRYAEGTGIRLMVHRPEDLAAIRKLVEIKLKN